MTVATSTPDPEIRLPKDYTQRMPVELESLPPLDPEKRPTMHIAEAGRYLGLGRAASYAAADKGVIPTIRLNARRRLVPTAALRRLLELGPVPADTTQE